MTIVGSTKQEKKIEELGLFAASMYPNLDKRAFKGAFRRAVQSSLTKLHYADWKEIAEKNADSRESFFKTVLEEATPILGGLGLSNPQIESLKKGLLRENKKYLQD